MTEIALGLMTALAWGFHDFFVWLVVKQVNTFTVLIVTNSIGTLGLLLLIFYWKEGVFIGQDFLLISIIYGAAFLIGTVSLFMAFNSGPVFVAAPIICSYPLLSLLYATIHGGGPTSYQWLLSSLVILGLSLTLAPQFGANLKFESNIVTTIFWSLVSALFFSISFHLGQNQIVIGHEISSNFFVRLAAIILLLSFSFRNTHFLKLRPIQIFILIFMGCADTFALTIMVYSGNFSNPELSSVSASTFGLITILLVCIVYRERLSIIQSLGVTLVFFSIGTLSLI